MIFEGALYQTTLSYRLRSITGSKLPVKLSGSLHGSGRPFELRWRYANV